MDKHFGCINFICYVESEEEDEKKVLLNNLLADLMLQFMDLAKAKGINIETGGFHSTGNLHNVCADCKHYQERPEEWQK